MGSYVDRDRKLIRKSTKTVMNSTDTSTIISKIVPIITLDDSRRVVFYSEFITSSTVHGIVSITSGFLMTILAGTAIVNGSNISWNSQQVTMEPMSYGIVSIHKTTKIAAILPGLHGDYVPISVVASTASSISVLIHLAAYGHYICSREQVYIDNEWQWAAEYSKLLCSGKNVAYSTSPASNEIYITFTRNGVTLRRRFSDSVTADWEYYPEYVDNASTRYMMPNDKSLRDGILAVSNNPITRLNATCNTYYGVFSPEYMYMDNIPGTGKFKYSVCIPRYTENSMVKRMRDADMIISSNGVPIATGKHSALAGTILQLPSSDPVDITIHSEYGLYVFSSEKYELDDSTRISNNPVYITPTNTQLVQGISASTNTAITNGYNPQATITAENIYTYHYKYDLLVQSTNTPITTGHKPSTTITGENIYGYQINADICIAKINQSITQTTPISCIVTY